MLTVGGCFPIAWQTVDAIKLPSLKTLNWDLIRFAWNTRFCAASNIPLLWRRPWLASKSAYSNDIVFRTHGITFLYLPVRRWPICRVIPLMPKRTNIVSHLNLHDFSQLTFIAVLWLSRSVLLLRSIVNQILSNG